jgi:hypothetical protein
MKGGRGACGGVCVCALGLARARGGGAARVAAPARWRSRGGAAPRQRTPTRRTRAAPRRTLRSHPPHPPHTHASSFRSRRAAFRLRPFRAAPPLAPPSLSLAARQPSRWGFYIYGFIFAYQGLGTFYAMVPHGYGTNGIKERLVRIAGA